MHHLEKMRREGLRTRDAHLLEALDRHPAVDRVFVIDRPVTRAERLLRHRASSRRTAYFPRELGLQKVEHVPVESDALMRPARLRSLWWLQAYKPANLTRASRAAVAGATSAVDHALAFVPTAHPLWAD